MLLDRKKRKPCYEDDTEVIVRSRCGSQDPPRKRVDNYKNGITYSQLSHGSPVTPRRNLYSPCPRRKEIDTLSGVVRGSSANRRRQFSGASSVSGASTVSSGPNSISGTGIHDPRSSNNNSDGIGQVPQSPIPSPKFAGRHSIGGENRRGTSPVHHPSGEGRSSLVSPAHENILMGSPQHNRHVSPSHHPTQGGTSKKIYSN